MKQIDLSQLTPEQKRVMIAEACGWHSIRQCTCKCQPHGLPAGTSGDRNYKHLPDYLNDLNAMHEAYLAFLNDGARRKFHRQLEIVVGDQLLDAYSPQAVSNATAPQRAEAFLLTVGVVKNNNFSATCPHNSTPV